jgi:hypothetical protein
VVRETRPRVAHVAHGGAHAAPRGPAKSARGVYVYPIDTTLERIDTVVSTVVCHVTVRVRAVSRRVASCE